MPTINPSKLTQFRNHTPAGTELTDELKTKTVDNDVAVIRFFEKSGGATRGFLTADPSPVQDVARKDKVLQATAQQLDSMKSDPAQFKSWLTQQISANQGYLHPAFGQLEGAPTRYKFNNIVGQRIDQVLNEATKLAKELYSGAKRNEALYAVNTAVRDLFDRKIEFDHFEINGYASFGHDATFLHVYEKKLEELNKVDVALLAPAARQSVERQKKQLQAEIDAIFRNKYVYHSSNMQETDAETTIGLVAIDTKSRQRISEVKDTRGTLVPAFEILNLTINGENRAVYYDADKDKYFFDGTSQEVPANQVADIARQKVRASDLSFRRAKSGEPLRKNFRFDWNGDGYVQQGKIDWVSWGGHCDDKAALEAAGVVVPEGHAGVHEYNSASGNKVHYTRDNLNEMLLSFSEMGSYMSKKTGGSPVKDIGTTEFAAARDDDRPDQLVLGNGRQIPLNSRPNKFDISQITKGGKTYPAADIFRRYLVADDKMSAEKNPLYKGTTEGDYVNLDLSGAVIKARVEVQVFDSQSGFPKMESKDVTLDFSNPPAEPILIDSVMADAGKRELFEIRLDVKNKKWMYQKIRMEKQADGSFKRVEIPGQTGSEGFNPANLTGKRETSLDNPAEYLPFVQGTQKTGVSATAETADGAGVWNGRLKYLNQQLEKREGSWERVRLDVSARYGSNTGRWLAHLDAKGEPDFYVPLDMPADFWWRQKVAFAPEKDGLVNSKAIERGVVTVEGGEVRADGLNDMLEVLHCAFNAKPYTIVHDGKRYFFDSKEAWEAEVAKLDDLRAGLTTGVGGEVPPPTGKLIQDAGSVGHDEYKRYTFTAAESGPITIKLTTLSGDADLFVKKGGEASASDHDAKSWQSGTSPDQLTIFANAGDTYSVAVHGYKASEFEIEASGPSSGGGSGPAAIDFSASGAVAKNEEQHFDVLTVPADGKLKINMTGDGDADVYVRIGAKPTKTKYDFRPYLDGSHESGELPVKAGDKVYVMVRGYGAQSTFNLGLKSEH